MVEQSVPALHPADAKHGSKLMVQLQACSVPCKYLSDNPDDQHEEEKVRSEVSGASRGRVFLPSELGLRVGPGRTRAACHTQYSISCDYFCVT